MKTKLSTAILGTFLLVTGAVSAAAETHSHGKGPHGGVVFDLGAHHAEFIVDHRAKEATVHILAADLKTAVPVGATELILTTKETKTSDGKVVPPMTVTLNPKDPVGGKSARFIGSDPAIGNVADFSGTVLAEIDGKPSQGEFEE
jgi:hypothetical protein